MQNRIQRLLIIAIALLSLALPACGEEGTITITIVDDRNWEAFDSKISPIDFQFNTDGGTKVRTYASWYSTKDTTYAYLNRTYVEADIPQNMPTLLAPYVPPTWSGPVEAHICHSYTLAAYDDLADSMTMDFPPGAAEDSIIKRDCLGFRTIFRQNDSFPGYPSSIPATVPDYVLVLDKDDNTVWADVRNKQITNTPSMGYAIYSAYYFPASGSTTWRKSQFPLRLYFLTFSTLQYVINVSVDVTSGAISPSGPVAVNHGENAEFTITANSGCRIAWLLVDGQRVAAENKYLCTYTFTGVTENHTISAIFEEDSSAPVATGDSGVTASVSDVVSSASDAVVAALEAGGFVSGGKTLHMVDTDKDTKMEGSFTANAGGFVQAVKLKADYEEGSESKGLTLTVKPTDAAKPFSADKKYYALLLNKKTNYYDVFPASLNGEGNLAVRIKPVGDYFSEGTIFIYSGSLYVSETPVSPDDPVNPSAGSKSGGGCRTGIAAFALLSLLPLLRKRR